MVRDLITLPLRLGGSATGLAARLAERAVSVGLDVTERMIALALTQFGDGAGPASADAAPAPPDMPVPAPPPVAPAPPEPPGHVSREPRLVESFADPGAEDGPGAAVRIEEPWTGYGGMTAGEVIARLADASPEELAATALYERAHRYRKTVLAAADRGLRQATAEARRP